MILLDFRVFPVLALLVIILVASAGYLVNFFGRMIAAALGIHL
jgi:hypothetical protein